MKIILRKSLLALSLMLISHQATAYVHYKCSDFVVNPNGTIGFVNGQLWKWPAAKFPIPFTADAAFFTAGSRHRTALDEVTTMLRNNPSLAYYKVTYGTPTKSFTDDKNDIWVDTTTPLLESGGVLAITSHKRTCPSGEITAADLVIGMFYDADPAGIWATSNRTADIGAYNGSFYLDFGFFPKQHSFQRVVLHEVGHVFGLNHENRYYNLMGNGPFFHNNGSTATTYLGQDATHGLMALYPPPADIVNVEDVSVSQWKFKAADGDTSLHQRTFLYNADGTATYTPYSSGTAKIYQPIYMAAGAKPIPAKSSVKAEFTFENNGATASQADVRIDYYLSSNSLITSLDTRLSSARILNLVRDSSPWVYARPLTLPARVPRDSNGITYLGVIVDRDNAIAEVDESSQSNATYMALRIAHSTEELQDALLADPTAPTPILKPLGPVSLWPPIPGPDPF